jgi:hypothetical protein
VGVTSWSRTERATADGLVPAAAFFTVAVLVHNADHVRRGVDSIDLDVFWAGTSAIVLEVAIVVLAFARHRLAPLVAAAGGLSLAVGYLAVHFLPARGWLSDSFTSGGDVSPLSWFAATLELVAALVVGAVGLAALRRPADVDGGPDAVAEAVRHPVPAAMIAGNAVVLAVSFAQLVRR